MWPRILFGGLWSAWIEVGKISMVGRRRVARKGGGGGESAFRIALAKKKGRMGSL